MITYLNRAGKLKEIVDDCAVIVTIRDDEMEVRGFADGKEDSLYRATADAAEVGEFIHRALIAQD